MSRVGRAPIAVPQGVSVALAGDGVTVTGPQGSLARRLPEGISVSQDGDVLVVARADDERHHRALHGLTRSLVANMVTGVTQGYAKELEIVGVGYRATSRGPQSIELALGFSHPVVVDAPEGVAQLLVEARGGRQRARRPVVDDLGGDVSQAAADREARPVGGTRDLAAHASMAPLAEPALLVGAGRHFAAFPALRRTRSPAYRTPLPL